MKQPNYKPTILACFIGYGVQALTINFAPLLYITFQNKYGMSLPQISSLIAVCFAVQLMTDAFAAKFSSKLKPRAAAVFANVLAAIGIAGMGLLPEIMPPYIGLLIATVLSGTGSGLVEVMISPIVEACPTKRKAAMMSLLHSFYCWGQATVVLLSNLFFLAVGIDDWKLLALLWAIIPTVDAILFLFVPLAPLDSDQTPSQKKTLFRSPVFWALIAVMACAGASEMAMSQWASYFAEAGLKVSNATGNLLGPCLFAILMGSARVIYGLNGSKIDIGKGLHYSAILCLTCYILAALSKNPIISLLGCAVCGFSVGLMWPGTLSMASGYFPKAGPALFAILALAGDIGCSIGPWIVGQISDFIVNSYETSMFLQNFGIGKLELGIKSGLLFIAVFPVIMIVTISFIKKTFKKF